MWCKINIPHHLIATHLVEAFDVCIHNSNFSYTSTAQAHSYHADEGTMSRFEFVEDFRCISQKKLTLCALRGQCWSKYSRERDFPFVVLQVTRLTQSSLEDTCLTGMLADGAYVGW